MEEPISPACRVEWGHTSPSTPCSKPLTQDPAMALRFFAMKMASITSDVGKDSSKHSAQSDTPCPVCDAISYGGTTMEARWGHVRQVHKLDFCGSCFNVVPHDDIGLHLAKCLRLDMLPLAGRSGASESTVERPTPLSTIWTPSAPSLVSSDSATEFQSTVSAVGRGAMIQSHAVPRTTPRVPEPLVHASARPGSAGSLSASPPSRGAHVSRRPPAIGTSFRDSTATSGVTSSSNARLDGAGDDSVTPRSATAAPASDVVSLVSTPFSSLSGSLFMGLPFPGLESTTSLSDKRFDFSQVFADDLSMSYMNSPLPTPVHRAAVPSLTPSRPPILGPPPPRPPLRSDGPTSPIEQPKDRVYYPPWSPSASQSDWNSQLSQPTRRSRPRKREASALPQPESVVEADVAMTLSELSGDSRNKFSFRRSFDGQEGSSTDRTPKMPRFDSNSHVIASSRRANILTANVQIAIEAYLTATTPTSCPLCGKVVQCRTSDFVGGNDAKKLRTERVRRWDHLRKTHDLTTCEKCNIRLPKLESEYHDSMCTGLRSQWLTQSHQSADSTLDSVESGDIVKTSGPIHSPIVIPPQPAASPAVSPSSPHSTSMLAETTGLSRDHHVGIEQYLNSVTEMPCPLCKKVAKVRDESADGRKLRSERSRRWDHLRKTHRLSTCDKCGTRTTMDKAQTHGRGCEGGSASLTRLLLSADATV